MEAMWSSGWSVASDRIAPEEEEEGGKATATAAEVTASRSPEDAAVEPSGVTRMGGGAAGGSEATEPAPVPVLAVRAAMKQAAGEASFSHWSGNMAPGGGGAGGPRGVARRAPVQGGAIAAQSSSGATSEGGGGSVDAVTANYRAVVTDVRVVQEFLQSPASAGLHGLLAKFR